MAVEHDDGLADLIDLLGDDGTSDPAAEEPGPPHPWDNDAYVSRQIPPDNGGGWVLAFLPVGDLRRDEGVQPREEMDFRVVDEYADAITNGVELPPGVAFEDADGTLWVADGFHRLAAAERAELRAYPMWCKAGARRDAILFAAGANSAHGLRRTNADKRKVVTTLLQDDEWGRWSDREVARRCAVSNVFVSKVRNELSVNGSQMKKRKVRRGDTEYEMNAAKGKKAKKKARKKKKKASTGKAGPKNTSTDDEDPGEDGNGEQDDQEPDDDEETGADAADDEQGDGVDGGEDEDDLDDTDTPDEEPDDDGDEDEDDEPDDDDTDDTDDSDGGDDEITLRDALAVVCGHLVAIGQVKAARIIGELARRAAIECWVGGLEDEPLASLSDLLGHVRQELDRYAEVDHDGASAWLEATVEEMWEVVNSHAPHKEVDDSGW